MLLDRGPRRWLAHLVDYAHGARGCLKCCLIVVLLVGVGALSALAYASAPDPVGLPGIYDDADYDDVVTLVTDTVGLGNSRLTSVDPVPLLLGVVSIHLAHAPRDGSLLSFPKLSPSLSANCLRSSRRHASRRGPLAPDKARVPGRLSASTHWSVVPASPGLIGV
jgi:hypothetical protein